VIPPLDPVTGYLPFASEAPLVVTLDEVAAAFVTSSWRERLWSAFEWWRRGLDEAGFPGNLRLAGSFVTGKPHPSDLDVALVVPAATVSVVNKMMGPNACLWTLQGVGLLRPDGFDWQWSYLTDRLQPVLGLIDAHRFAAGSAAEASFARDWTSEHDDDGQPTGARKGWLEVSR
jgi:hypothetical protein